MRRTHIPPPHSGSPDAGTPWLRTPPFLFPSRVGKASRVPVLVLAVALLVVWGCRGHEASSDPGLEMELAVSPTPPAVGPAQLLLTLHDTAGQPLEGARITVEGNMSHAGMVPVLDTAWAREPGEYVVDDFDFTMAGDWVLTVEATLPDGRQARLEHATTVVGSPPGIMDDTTGHAGHDTLDHTMPEATTPGAAESTGKLDLPYSLSRPGS